MGIGRLTVGREERAQGAILPHVRHSAQARDVREDRAQPGRLKGAIASGGKVNCYHR